MRNKYFTFLYIPGNNVEPRTVRVRRGLIFSLAVVIAVAAAAASWTAFKYSGKIKDIINLVRNIEKKSKK